MKEVGLAFLGLCIGVYQVFIHNNLRKQLNILENNYQIIIRQQREIEKMHSAIKKPGANRSSRTPEQRAAAAEKRKAWWEKKRGAETSPIPPSVFDPN